MKAYRPINQNEIQQLQSQACKCADWNLIKVAEKFSPDNIIGVSFSGNIQLGVFQKEFKSDSGVIKKSGIYNAAIHNCNIGDNVYINHITNQIANYSIGKNCFIENIDLLETNPKSTFGNGVKVAVLDETGSREVPIFDKLTSATAYLLSTYKHNAALISSLEKLIEKQVQEKQSDIGTIEEDVTIRNSTAIINVNIGSGSKIDGIALLKNGTVCSDTSAPTMVGHQVIAKDFIIGKGSKVLDGSQLEVCFVGEACLISKQFSAMHSLFFANCEMLHGEAVSVFAGPFTVSHHKSTLLIGGMFSFFNAGSGSNMSNHMYKLGPIHYGVMQRGCKMASDSYLMWPGKIGSFSVVIGKIKKHIDTSALPFSYIIDSKGEYSLMPAMNLTSIGTYRDRNKWLNRDGRKNSDKLDGICFESLNPYIIHQIYIGIETLSALKEKNSHVSAYTYNNCKINAAFIDKAIMLYQMIIDIYIGDCLLQNETKNESFDKWIDLAGMILPEKKINELLEDTIKEKITSIETWNTELNTLHNNYKNYKPTCAQRLLQADKATLIQYAIVAHEKYKNLLIGDALKEFSEEARTCFGLDQDEDGKDLEFLNIRGEFDNNPIVKTIEEECKKKVELLKKL